VRRTIGSLTAPTRETVSRAYRAVATR
jgi:hypothetical protein